MIIINPSNYSNLRVFCCQKVYKIKVRLIYTLLAVLITYQYSSWGLPEANNMEKYFQIPAFRGYLGFLQINLTSVWSGYYFMYDGCTGSCGALGINHKEEGLWAGMCRQLRK